MELTGIEQAKMKIKRDAFPLSDMVYLVWPAYQKRGSHSKLHIWKRKMKHEEWTQQKRSKLKLKHKKNINFYRLRVIGTNESKCVPNHNYLPRNDNAVIIFFCLHFISLFLWCVHIFFLLFYFCLSLSIRSYFHRSSSSETMKWNITTIIVTTITSITIKCIRLLSLNFPLVIGFQRQMCEKRIKIFLQPFL